MAAKKKAKASSKKKRTTKKKATASGSPKPKEATTAAVFPNTNKPGTLRKFLNDIPNKPKPPKVDANLLKSWGYRDGNDYSIVRVLKKIGLLSNSNVPTDLYTDYMRLQGGAGALAGPVKDLYEPLFHASHEPYNESTENLKNLFNIHSGGGERSIELQMQTFKALCENTSFSGDVMSSSGVASSDTATSTGAHIATGGTHIPSGSGPSVNINLHIHLPENKSRRDYEAIIEDIGRYIFGRTESGDSNEP